MIYQEFLTKISQKTLGRSATDAMIARDGKITFKRFRKQRRRLNELKREFRCRSDQLKALQRSCAAHMQTVESPLVLISQLQRSGGTLLSQLFDGHPEVHAHPHELKIGFPTKYVWPEFHLDEEPERWLQVLFEPVVLKHFKSGYKKQKNMDETFLFLFLPAVQKELFLRHLGELASVTQRDVFNAYMTSYFGAWLNNQNSAGQKKFIIAFTARLAMDESNVKSFFEIYPDGRLISIIRDPKNWYPSAARHKPSIYGNIRESLQLWRENAEAMLRNKALYGERVCVLTFEDLILHTEAVMRFLADFLQIAFDDCLLIPSFNKFPIRANTSFKDQQAGIIESTLNRYKTLTQEQLQIIADMTTGLYREVLKICSKIS
ncbi:MAG: sulfotransferase [Deltaproteobacteria bacterium]|nr:sulfotransferase [Deltaproteobacteria bacterium]MBW2069618.1 sulfotransferase [Deltaproteobacteria bacterium]